MFTDLLKTGAELMTSRRQQVMTSLFLLLTLSLQRTISYVDVSRQNSVLNDDDDSNNNNYDNSTG